MASFVMIEVDESGNTNDIRTVEMPRGMDTIAEFEEWLEETLFKEDDDPE